MKFNDRDNKSFEITLRASFGYIKNQNQLKSILDNNIGLAGINRLHPTWSIDLKNKMVACWAKKSYMSIMRDFGMLTKSIYLEVKL